VEQWKLNIFVNAVTALKEREGKTVEEILNKYTKLTIEDKQQIKQAILQMD